MSEYSDSYKLNIKLFYSPKMFSKQETAKKNNFTKTLTLTLYKQKNKIKIFSIT